LHARFLSFSASVVAMNRISFWHYSGLLAEIHIGEELCPGGVSRRTPGGDGNKLNG
jgi:hypothetical protein